MCSNKYHNRKSKINVIKIKSTNLKKKINKHRSIVNNGFKKENKSRNKLILISNHKNKFSSKRNYYKKDVQKFNINN